ncbi:transposase family protein [Gemmata obscuriglobus]|uniref:transposase family protein n=1 Tax=Gemmata obscuriglobus TaxID=114 RepID=UPI0004956834
MQGRIDPLRAVLGLVTLSLLMGRTSLQGIARFGRQHGFPLAHALGFRRGKTPAASTLSRTLRRFDPQQLEAARTRWLDGRVGPVARVHIALDGKTLRGSRHGDGSGAHRLTAYAPAARGAGPGAGGRQDRGCAGVPRCRCWPRSVRP